MQELEKQGMINHPHPTVSYALPDRRAWYRKAVQGLRRQKTPVITLSALGIGYLLFRNPDMAKDVLAAGGVLSAGRLVLPMHERLSNPAEAAKAEFSRLPAGPSEDTYRKLLPGDMPHLENLVAMSTNPGSITGTYSDPADCQRLGIAIARTADLLSSARVQNGRYAVPTDRAFQMFYNQVLSNNGHDGVEELMKDMTYKRIKKSLRKRKGKHADTLSHIRNTLYTVEFALEVSNAINVDHIGRD